MDLFSTIARRARFPRLRRLWDNRRGVAAIEFAFIAPLLLTMYFVTMEIAPAIDTSKKVGRSASMIADLITQQQAVTAADIEAIMQIGNATLMPYSRTKLTVTVTAIDITDEDAPKVKVAWSRKMDNGAFSKPFEVDSVTTVPPALKVRNSFLIRVQTTLRYTPIIAWTPEGKEATGLLAAFSEINMGDTYYLRPRMSSKVSCSGC